MPPPTGLTADQIGCIGHSNVNAFISRYRVLSSRDLLAAIQHASLDARVWGEPTDPGHDEAWTRPEDDEPVGGYRAFMVFLGFLDNYSETGVQQQAWATHIRDQIDTLFPTVEWIWWAPMGTYFATDPGDGDGQTLVDIVNDTGWPAVFAGAPTVGPLEAYDLMVYAVANDLADDYGPWINLTDALCGVDNRHPTDPDGEIYGGQILKDFFDGTAHTTGVGAVRTGTLT